MEHTTVHSPTPLYRKRPFLLLKAPRKYTLFIVIGLFVVALFFFVLSTSKKSQTRATGGQDTPRSSQSQGAVATHAVNREFSFVVKNRGTNNQISIAYVIENAEVRDEIIVRGQRARAASGREFLILTIKLINRSTQPLIVQSRDYVRLSRNNNTKEWLAPDIHNDPVEVQAISTKPTRVGFAVNTTDTNFLLSVGEIEGQKETIKLTLP